MDKQEIISSLHRKIENCRREAKHYYDKADSDPESREVWKELQGYYDGRVSAFEWSLRTIEEIS